MSGAAAALITNIDPLSFASLLHYCFQRNFVPLQFGVQFEIVLWVLPTNTKSQKAPYTHVVGFYIAANILTRRKVREGQSAKWMRY